jgi:hypothetical protein
VSIKPGIVRAWVRKMTELKTKKTGLSVSAFISGIEDEQTRKDCKALLALFKDATQATPRMWGPAIVGFGDFHYSQGRQSYEWFLAGFSPRKQNLVLYLMSGYEPFPELMAKLGKYKTGKSCLYLKRLSDADPGTLKKLLAASLKQMKSDPRFSA